MQELGFRVPLFIFCIPGMQIKGPTPHPPHTLTPYVSLGLGQWLEAQGASSSDDPASLYGTSTHHPPLWQIIIILKFYLGCS